MLRPITALARVAATGALSLAVLGVGDCLSAHAAGADTLSVAQSASSLPRGNPETLTFNSNANPIDSSGDGPYLYAVVQPSGAGACQATYGSDLQVVGSQAVRLTPNANQEVKTGQDSHAYAYTSYAAGNYTVCSWLETDPKDSSTSGDTSSVVTASATSSFAVQDTDALSVSYSSANPQAASPVAVTFASQASPIDSNGDGPYLYAVLQPASAGGCQPTYGADLRVVGTQATALTPSTGIEVKTGQDSHSYNYTAYSAGSDTVCSWLETDPKDSSMENDTASVVTAANSSVLTIGNPDTNAASVSDAAPHADQPFTVTLSGKAVPTDANGDTPFLYSVLQPTSVGGCGASYGDDLQVAGSQASILVRAVPVTSPSYVDDTVVRSDAGAEEICSWLETVANDGAALNAQASAVLASAGPVALEVAPALVSPAPKLTGGRLSGLAGGKPALAFTVRAVSGTVKSVRVTVPAGLSLRSTALVARYVKVTSGAKVLSHRLSRGGRSLTITLIARSGTVSVAIEPRALTESAALRRAVRARRQRVLGVSYLLTNTTGAETKGTFKARV